MVAGAASSRFEDKSWQVRQRALAGQFSPFPERKRKIACRLQEAPKPMVILSSQVSNAFDKALRIVPRVHTAQSSPRVVGDEHDPHGVFLRLPENVPDNADHEVHGRRIVIDEEHPAHRLFDGLFAAGAISIIG